MLRRLGCTAVCLLLLTTRSDASRTVVIRAQRPIIMANEALRITVLVDPQPDQWQIVIDVDGDFFARSSKIDLFGDNGPRQSVITYHPVPSGDYQLTAIVGDRNGKIVARGSARVTVF